MPAPDPYAPSVRLALLSVHLPRRRRVERVGRHLRGRIVKGLPS